MFTLICVSSILRESAIMEVPLQIRPRGSDFSFGHLGASCKEADLRFPLPGESSIAESHKWLLAQKVLYLLISAVSDPALLPAGGGEVPGSRGLRVECFRQSMNFVIRKVT